MSFFCPFLLPMQSFSPALGHVCRVIAMAGLRRWRSFCGCARLAPLFEMAALAIRAESPTTRPSLAFIIFSWWRRVAQSSPLAQASREPLQCIFTSFQRTIKSLSTV